MNKLAVLAMVILAALGGAMWYLAGGALNDYLKRQLIENGQQLTQHHITVGKVEMRMTEGQGSINNIVIYPRPNTANTAPNSPIVHIEKLSVAFDADSVKKAPMVINHLTLNNAVLKKSPAMTTALQQLLAVTKQQRAIKVQELAKTKEQIEPYVLVQQAQLTSGATSYPLKLSTNEQGDSLSLMTADILINVLKILIEESQVTEQ